MASNHDIAAKALAVVVNDDAVQRMTLAGLLAADGFAVQDYDGAAAALTGMSHGAPPDLIVTDLYMPGIDGWRFCRLLRSPEYVAFNRVPVLVVSATYSGEEATRITADLGANAFLSMPVQGRQFVEQARALCAGSLPLQQPRVLIVDDSGSQRTLLRQTFEAHGYLVADARDVAAAAGCIASAAPDVAVIDYHMPGQNGDELLERLRAQCPQCVCVMMTSDPQPGLSLAWMQRGAAAYLRKPFDPEYMVELCGRARREQALLRVEDLLEERTRELRQSEEKMRLLLEHVPDAVYTLSSEGTIVSWNPGAQRMFGFSAGEIVGQHFSRLVPSRFREQHRVLFEKFAAAEQPYFSEWPREGFALRKDGSEFPFEQTLAVYPIGGTRYCTLIIRDISARVRAEKLLRQSEDRYRLLVDTAPDAIYILDTQGRIITWNAAAEKIFGYTEKEILGRNIAVLTPLQHRNAQERDFHSVIASQQVPRAASPLVEPAIKKDGTEFIMEHTYAGFEIDGERFVFTIARDVTERVRSQAERERLQDQLRQAQKMESIGQLAGGVAHDFNNMLGVIMGHAELALEEVDAGQPLYDDLNEIQAAARRSSEITRQLLAFARKQTVAPRCLNLNTGVSSMIRMLQRLIGENIVLEWRPGEEVWPVWMDPSQIDQILVNLCVNARDAISGSGRLVIGTGTAVLDERFCADHTGCLPGDYVLLSVSDDGCGMDREALDHLFEPFYTTKEQGQGTGMGLATVYGVVKQNRGVIDVASEPGRGTTFTIYLPRHRGTEKATPVTAATDSERCKCTETILLVEDEPELLALGCKMLSKRGYHVLTANSPGDAIRQAEQNDGPIHLLITDVIMPEMNGRELSERLQARCASLKCLFMSGYTANIISDQGVLEPGVMFIQKPFSRADLISKVREVLDG